MINFKQLLVLIKSRWIEFRREPSAILWVAIMPVLWMVGLGFAFNNPTPEIYRLAIVDNGVSQELVKQLQADKLQVISVANDDKNQALIKDLADVVLTYRDTVTSEYLYDKKSPFAKRARDFFDSKIQVISGQSKVFLSEDKPVKVPGARYIDFLIPGLLALSIMSSSLFGTGMTIVSNRRDQLLKRYVITPMKSSHFILSHIFGRFFVLLFEFSVIILTGWIIFRFGTIHSITNMFIFSCFGAACFTSLALLIGAKTKNVAAMGGMINLAMFPMILLCGVFFSTKTFPSILQKLINFLPMTHLCEGLRYIVREGMSVWQLGPQIFALVIFTLVFSVLAKVRFKWY